MFHQLACLQFWNEPDEWSNGDLSMDLPETNRIRINELYRDYAPPFDVSAIVHQLLLTVPDKYLTGLDCIVLTYDAGLSRRDRVGKVWSRGRKYNKSGVLGRYHGSRRGHLSYIELRVDKIVSGFNRTVLRIPLLRDVAFGKVLFHELGHHIHRTIRPEIRGSKFMQDGRLVLFLARLHPWPAFARCFRRAQPVAFRVKCE
jgi:hypothetical protein